MILNIPIPTTKLFAELGIGVSMVAGLIRYYTVIARIDKWNSQYEVHKKYLDKPRLSRKNHNIYEIAKVLYLLYALTAYLPVTICQMILMPIAKMFKINIPKQLRIYGLPVIFIIMFTDGDGYNECLVRSDFDTIHELELKQMINHVAFQGSYPTSF